MSGAACAWYRAAGLATIGIAITLVGLQACSSGCDEEMIDRAVAFLDTHQDCATDGELHDCAPESCSVCAAALIPTCTDGSCRGTE